MNEDTFFKVYKNTSLNLIPLIHNGEKKVYVLTGPQETGVDNLTGKKQPHKNIIRGNYGNKTDAGSTLVGAMHTHLPETGDFTTSTDICTLMFYEKFAQWKQHTVVSKNYLSLWNSETDTLVIILNNTADESNKNKTKNKD